MSKISLLGSDRVEDVPATARTLSDALRVVPNLSCWTPVNGIVAVPATADVRVPSYEAALAIPGARAVDPRNQSALLADMFAPGALGTLVIRTKEILLSDIMFDIGVFTQVSADVGSDWLRDHEPAPLALSSTSGDQGRLLDDTLCAQLCQLLDTAHASSGDDDFKMAFERETTPLVPSAVLDELSDMVHGATRFVLRRTVARGAWIPFHVDVASETVQVPLRSDVDGAGGQLVFLHADKPCVIQRRAGVPVYHEGTAVHGVTAFRAGVRYALYALRTTQTSF